jgi:hypothetical protein
MLGKMRKMMGNMGKYGENMGEYGRMGEDAGNNVVEDEEHDEDMVEEKTIMVERGWENLCGDIWLGMGGSFFFGRKEDPNHGGNTNSATISPKSCLVKIGVMNLDHGRVYHWPFLWEVDDAS